MSSNSEQLANGYVPVHSTFQLFAVIATGGTLIFYTLQIRSGKRGGWEPVYVSMVEFLAYFISFLLPDEYSFLPLGERSVPVFRYVSWLTTCPIILKVLVTIMTETGKTPDHNLILQLMLGITWIELFGFMGNLYDGFFKDVCIALACCGMLVLYYAIFQTWTNNKDTLDRLKQRYELVVLLLVSWLLFPAFYILGPNMMKIVNNQISVIGHVVGDLLAKNIWGMLAWKFNRKTSSSSGLKEIKVESHGGDKVVRQESSELVVVNTPQSEKNKSEKVPKHVQEFLLQYYLQSKSRRPGHVEEAMDETGIFDVREVESSNQQHSPSPTLRRAAKQQSPTPYFGIGEMLKRPYPSSEEARNAPGNIVREDCQT